MIDAILWLVPLAIGVVFGWAWGTTRTAATLSRSPDTLPHTSGNWRAGYLVGFENAREECLRIAKAHDFETIGQQVSRIVPRP